jgi:hypothetical protein
MDVDEQTSGTESESGGMDVDDDDSPRKRRKSNDGSTQVAPIGKRAPKTDRSIISMRDATVSRMQSLFQGAY